MVAYGRKMILVFIDIFSIWASVYIAYFLMFHGTIPAEYHMQAFKLAVLSTVICTVMLYYHKLYSRIWRYASVVETLEIVKSVVISSVVSYAIMRFIFAEKVYWIILLMAVQTMVISIGGVRLLWKFIYITRNSNRSNTSKTLIIGAGDCGSLIAKELMTNPSSKMLPVAFVDDDPVKHQHQILGIPVLGSRKDILHIVNEMSIEHIIIAMPSIPKSEIRQIIDICKETKAKLKIVPILNDIIVGKINIQSIRDVQVEDLLGREPVNTDLEGIADYVREKTVLVTGAGGSIGSELCRQIALFRPRRLLLLGHGENSIYTIEMELRNNFSHLAIIPIIADVQDRARIEQVFEKHRPQVVFHAAAHKHVPLMEANPAEAIKNNVFGSKNVAECAHLFGAERFVMISTDKAVNPTSVMGTTKRIAEMIVQSTNAESKTVFAAVRFGNVLGSRGSVIPRFKEQIKRGGPVTVTHPEMVRYFMTIPEAVQLVIQAGALAQGGEVFVLDMGEPVKIVDLAKGLIKMSGLEPNVDIKIQYSGIRPGEKLYEELLTSEEGLSSTTHNRIFIGKAVEYDRNKLKVQVNNLEQVLDETDRIRDYLQQLVPTYCSPDMDKESLVNEKKDLVTDLVLVGV